MRACSGSRQRTDRQGAAAVAWRYTACGRAAVGVTETGRSRGGERLLWKRVPPLLSPGAVVGRQGSWLPHPICTRWWATLSDARDV